MFLPHLPSSRLEILLSRLSKTTTSNSYKARCPKPLTNTAQKFTESQCVDQSRYSSPSIFSEKIPSQENSDLVTISSLHDWSDFDCRKSWLLFLVRNNKVDENLNEMGKLFEIWTKKSKHVVLRKDDAIYYKKNWQTQHSHQIHQHADITYHTGHNAL